MATGTLISVEEYLHASYRPDRDYVDGEVLERNLGEQGHGRLQWRIGAGLFPREAGLRVRGMSEVRLQIGSRRFRIPDVMVLSADAPHDPIVRTAPLLCIEILSKGDSLASISSRIEDYFSIGVPVCWVIDPASRMGWIATPPAIITKAADGILRAGEIEMPLAEVLEPPAA